jgi:hypothetical protein
MKLIILLCTILAGSAHAVTFEIKNLCDDSAYYTEEIEILTDTTVGHLTIHTLNTSDIEYAGTENGINTILNTPVGLDAYEILADNRMRVYGWCYEIDGAQPATLASQFPIDPDSDCKLTWFYGYAELVNDDWISYCTPVYKNPHAFVCK